VIWQEYSSQGYEIIYKEEDLPVQPFAGQWAAWLGGVYGDDSYLWQTITIPADHPYLSYWRYIISSDYCGFNYDFARVLVDGDTVESLELCEDNNTFGWVQKVLDLHAYAGKSVELMFFAHTDYSLESNLFIDHIMLLLTMNDANYPQVTPTYIDPGSVDKYRLGK